MRIARLIGVCCTVPLIAFHTAAGADEGKPGLSFTTLSITPFAIEGLTTNNLGDLFTTGRAPAGTRCPVWRIVLLGTHFCAAQSDGDRRDNSPRAEGEVNGGAANPGTRGKISCADQPVIVPGLRLPVQ